MAEVDLDNVTKIYPGNVKAVDDISLRIEDEEFIVLVGPSGCGKSTTLRMVAGLEEITSGTIRIGERIVNDVPPKDRDIAMVFQNYALYPHMTVYKNMAFGLKLRGYKKKQIDERVRWAAEILGLGDLLARKPKALSGGQRQRLSIARAVLLDPPVLILDDSTSSVDVETERQIHRAMTEVIKGRTTFVIAHRLSSVREADVILVLKDGEIVEQGNHAELMSLGGSYKDIYELQLRPQEEVLLDATLTGDDGGDS